MTDRPTLLATLDALLQPERFKDYCPNGLQVVPMGCAQNRLRRDRKPGADRGRH